MFGPAGSRLDGRPNLLALTRKAGSAYPVLVAMVASVPLPESNPMQTRRAQGGICRPPFPVYEQLVDDLLTKHAPASATRDATVAHVLGTCAGYAYSDIETLAVDFHLELTRQGCG